MQTLASAEERSATMRPQGKQQQDVDPRELCGDVALLICESRLPDPVGGRAEGPHCPGPLKNLRAEHRCVDNDVESLCWKAAHYREKAGRLFSQRLPLCIRLLLSPADCSSSDHCPTGALLLEEWKVCAQHMSRSSEEEKKLLPPQFLLQAIRSFLHFSLLSAWLSKCQGKIPYRMLYKVSLFGEEDLEESGEHRPGEYEEHNFPSCRLDRGVLLAVSVRSLRRSADSPTTACLCGGSSGGSGSLSRPRPSSASALSGDGRPCGGEEAGLATRLDAMRLSAGACAAAGSPENPSPVSFYIAEEEEGNLEGGRSRRRSRGSVPPPCSSSSVTPPSSPSAAPTTSKGSLRPARVHGKRASQKILFTADEEPIVPVSPSSGEPSPASAACYSRVFCEESRTEPASGIISRKTSFTEGCYEPKELKRHNHDPQKKIPEEQSFPTHRSFASRSGLPLHLSAEKRFSRRTGLPLNSSPAPLKRNQHSFNYDSSLSSVAGIKSALCSHDHDSGSSDSEGGSSLCRSAPASSHLLGNFEESALNGRIKPFGSIDGFMLDLAASGAFCPPHVSLPVTTFFFNVSDDNAPSPYLGHCNLEHVGKKGYHVPRRGNVQATLFNPQGTVVKMFVVRYDMGDMPPSSQTFVRQRTFYMPTTATLQDARQNRSWLRYLIHLRFSSSTSGKLYLHTDIRMLFSRKSELDANCLEWEGEGASCSGIVPGTHELRSFTEMPKDPKYSPRRFGGGPALPAASPLEGSEGDPGEASEGLAK